MSQTVTWEKQGRVAIIQLWNPPINCVNGQFLEELDHTLANIEQSKEIRVLVIVSANPKVFAVGRQDQNEADRDLEKQQLSKVMKRLLHQPRPTIAVISGSAIGAGFELALACDLRISSELSKFGFYSNISPTDIGTVTLIELAGHSKAKEFIWLGQVLSAQAAREMDIVNRIFPDSHLVNEGIEMAHVIAHQSEKSLSLWKSYRNQAIMNQVVN